LFQAEAGFWMRIESGERLTVFPLKFLWAFPPSGWDRLDIAYRACDYLSIHFAQPADMLEKQHVCTMHVNKVRFPT
jgi:hypothetical protein